MKIKAAVIGATGYAGAELVRLLLKHPNVELTALCSKSFEGQKLSDIYPSFLGLCDKVCINQSEAVDMADVVFACLPHGQGSVRINGDHRVAANGIQLYL